MTSKIACCCLCGLLLALTGGARPAPADPPPDTIYHTTVNEVDVRLLIPAEYADKPLRGAILHVANYKLKTDDRWAELGRSLGFGHVAIQMDMRRTRRARAMRNALLAAMRRFADASGRKELNHVPFVGVGHSAGGMAINALSKIPERTLTNAKSCAWVSDPEKLGRDFAQIPMCITIGAIPDAFKMLPGVENRFRPARNQRLPWALVLQHGCAHDWGNSATLFVPWIESVAALRLDPRWDPPAKPVQLKPVDARTGWLGDLTTTDANWAKISPAGQFQGDRSKTAWLPDRATAMIWRAMLSKNTPVQLTARTVDGRREIGPFRPKSSFEMTVPADGSVVLGVTRPRNGRLTGVTFYRTDKVLGQAGAAPWTWTWKQIPAGPHAVWARWTLADGSQGATNPALLIRRHGPKDRKARTIKIPAPGD